MKPLSTPSVTPAQVVAVIGAIIAVAVAYGAPIDDRQADTLIELAMVLSSVLLAADTAIRAARAKYIAGKREG